MHPTNSELQARSVIFFVSFVCESADQSQVSLGCIEDPLFWKDRRGIKFQLYSSCFQLKMRHQTLENGIRFFSHTCHEHIENSNCTIKYFQLSGAIICTLTPAGKITQQRVAQRVDKNRANEQNLYICCYLMIHNVSLT